MSLLILVSSGWSIKHQQLPDTDIYLPVAFIFLLIYVILTGINKVTEENYDVFSVPFGWYIGFAQNTLRMMLYAKFLLGIRAFWNETFGELRIFVTRFLALGTLYFFAEPIIGYSCYLFDDIHRLAVITASHLVLHTMALAWMTFLFSNKSLYYKLSAKSRSILPTGDFR